jgi:DNA-binding transcriptional regulator YiaG
MTRITRKDVTWTDSSHTMTPTLRQMGTTLKRLRTKKKLGQAALARRAGLSRSTSTGSRPAATIRP